MYGTGHTIRLAAAAALLAASAGAQAIVVNLDFADFDTRLGELTTSAGVAAFSGGEITTIRDTIQSQMETAYAAFTVSVQQDDATGANETVRFGGTTSPGGLGVAENLDLFNQQDNVADVFSANFAFIVEAGDARAMQITELSTALAGTAVHELGHNLGLRHYDAFGDPLVTPGSSTVTCSGCSPLGQQNTHVMATGSTGLGETGRETERDFSELSNIKLEYADGVGSKGSAGINAEGTNGNDLDGLFESLSPGLTDLEVAVMNGTLADVDEVDEYSFSGTLGDRLIANVLSSGYGIGGSNFIGDALDTILELVGPGGSLIEVDDIYYDTDSVGAVGQADVFRTLDTLLLNFELPTTGEYMLRVKAFPGALLGGEYALVAARSEQADLAVPAPATLALVMSGLAVIGWRRRRA